MTDLDKLHKILEIRNDDGSFRWTSEIGARTVEFVHIDSDQVVVSVVSEDVSDALSLAIRSFELKGFFEKDYVPFRDTM
ncbi:MAG: hypothetical protein GY827_04530 [Cytophagales bacterium]|nr:hypothetical protein [Cytophagales bacterium]